MAERIAKANNACYLGLISLCSFALFSCGRIAHTPSEGGAAPVELATSRPVASSDAVHALWVYFRTGRTPQDTNTPIPAPLKCRDPLTLIVEGVGEFPLIDSNLPDRISGHITRYLLVLPENTNLTLNDLYDKKMSVRIDGKTLWITTYVWIIATTQDGYSYSIVNDSWEVYLLGTAPPPDPQKSPPLPGKPRVFGPVDVRKEHPLPRARPRGVPNGSLTTVAEYWVIAETAADSGPDISGELSLLLSANGPNDTAAGGLHFPATDEGVTKLPKEVCRGHTTNFANILVNSFMAHQKMITIAGTGSWRPSRVLTIVRANSGHEIVEYFRYWPGTLRFSEEPTIGRPWHWLIEYSSTPPDP